MRKSMHAATPVWLPLLASIVLAAGASAQSPNPDVLRRIIAQKNAEAAAATWAGHPGFGHPAPSGPGSPSSPADAPADGRNPSGQSQGTAASGGASFDTAGASFDTGGTSFDTGTSGKRQTVLAAGPLSSSTKSGGQASNGPGSASLAQSAPGEREPSSDNAGHDHPTSLPDPAGVRYVGGLLSIHCNDSSLQQTLREASLLIGIAIVGSVPEERVFGDYGPGDPATVISALLYGTVSNQLIRSRQGGQLMELVLTPRARGAASAGATGKLDAAVNASPYRENQ